MNTNQPAEAAKRTMSLDAILDSVPQQRQRQDSTNDQLRDLRCVANRLGMYDAADTIRNILEHCRG